ncbi:MAG TPA: lipid IV(A) 3-deoxy-D-manno-octulosonic acid transferase [Gammaproteobacteria bacterium]|nr:lipid IV(A) 3-deoxy-D-manno-octulosonic acid transferase [Gammaproteobacteria bacterium]
MLRRLYNVFFTLLLPVVFVRLLIKSVSLPEYRYRWKERLGFIDLPNLKETLWVHAVSVGEAIAAVPIIQRFLEKYPNTKMVITTMTPTGSQRVIEAFKENLGKDIFHVYVPYDISWCVKRFLKRTNPKLVILMETELWPNILHYCGKKKIEVLIANGRLSATSVSRYQKMSGVVKNMLSEVSMVAAQSQEDISRFLSIGMKKNNIHNTGNIKFELLIPPHAQEKGTQLRKMFGGGRPVWIAASTHDGEERLILSAFKQLKRQFSNLMLILVPRHPERFDKVFELCQQEGFKAIRRSQKTPCTPSTDIYLGDTMGELLTFYAASDLAFVGGSLVPIGGHNLLEPAALGLPVLTGPHLFNFTAISELLFQAKGAQKVTDVTSIVQVISELLSNAKMRHRQGQRAKDVVQKNKGALEKLFTLIDTLWGK